MRYVIPLGSRSRSHVVTDFAIQLRKVGPNVFVRYGGLLMIDRREREGTLVQIPRLSFYIVVDAQDFTKIRSLTNPKGIHLPKSERIRVHQVIPESHWDETNRMFFTPDEDNNLIFAASCFIIDGDSKVQMIICFASRREGAPTYRILLPDKIPEHKEQSLWLFSHKRRGYDVTWDDVEMDLPNILGITGPRLVDTGEGQLRISLSLGKRSLSSISEKRIFSIDFDYESSFDNNSNESQMSRGASNQASIDGILKDMALEGKKSPNEYTYEEGVSSEYADDEEE
ncbi:hypothetical protein N431DRAFT_111251 [Stipitochalara longipes BDJ]|nr:hypothetical protein N431DRAFT_111251 [Stipitochalara longipes BDJ]